MILVIDIHCDYLVFKMHKRNCTLNNNLQTKYLFVKQRSDTSGVTCEKCRINFIDAHGGVSDIEKHL